MESQAENNRIALQVYLAARPSRVFQSLLNPDDLSHWFCQNAETSHQVGEHYLFWGSDSIAVIYSEGEGGGAIHGLEAGRSLWYTWRISGADTDVVFYVKPAEDGGTILQCVHQGILPGLMLMDFWHLRLYALRAYLEGRESPGSYNFTARPITNIRRDTTIQAKPADIFAALIESEHVSNWMSAQAQVDARVGGLYDLGWRDDAGYMAGPQEILDISKGQGLAYRWQFGEEQGVGQEVQWLLKYDGHSTQVLLDHIGFSEERDNRDYDQGWMQLLWSLKTYVEEGLMPIQVLEGNWGL